MSKIIYVSDDMGLDSPPSSPKKSTVDAGVATGPNPTPTPVSSQVNSIGGNGVTQSTNTATTVSTSAVSAPSKVPDEEHIASNELSSVAVALNNDDSSLSGSDYSEEFDGYNSQGGDDASVSSLNTDELLKVDPMYFRLTKFLQTGGMNVAEILSGIHLEMKNLNENLSKFTTK